MDCNFQPCGIGLDSLARLFFIGHHAHGCGLWVFLCSQFMVEWSMNSPNLVGDYYLVKVMSIETGY